MPLYEITDDELVPFRRLHGGADLYEKEIEDLLWTSMEEMTGQGSLIDEFLHTEAVPRRAFRQGE